MLGFTGTTPDGRKISVQGSGMGMPSLSIYVNELIKDYRVKRIIRVGSAGALRSEIECQSIVVAQGACSDSALNKRRFDGMSFAPIASWKLLKRVDDIIKKIKPESEILYGNIVSVDKFYEDVEPLTWKIFSEYGVLAIEMESAELYTLGARHEIETLSLLTISDNLITQKHLSPLERESSFEDMMEIAIRI